ncbi:hypothetical protein HMPREF1531_00136 [Propionibacterium sp. oral taxon 192 str. F0372]|uniref:hypothetical protein n=1 Tax=Propionibacterium sp. oral taxon 192 TaxID=671222 RepID=UPI0003546FC1|nr:hypothetical protein [Propionibacterium sp. oral taxon 192]EPH07087.1 hypothetical protein HMPREF1531_00136 [Propionibacterium sp. oral taxon 192 str. F0372]
MTTNPYGQSDSYSSDSPNLGQDAWLQGAQASPQPWDDQATFGGIQSGSQWQYAQPPEPNTSGVPSYAQPMTPSPRQAMAPYNPVYGRPQVSRKEPWLSLVASFFIPGLGSIINGETSKGIGILVGFFACIFTSFLIVPIIGIIAFFVWGLVDAYQGAERFNTYHGLR